MGDGITIKETLTKYAHMDAVLSDKEVWGLGFVGMIVCDLWSALRAGQAEIDAVNSIAPDIDRLRLSAAAWDAREQWFDIADGAADEFVKAEAWRKAEACAKAAREARQ